MTPTPSFTYRSATVNDTHQLKTLGFISYGQHSHILSPDNWARLRDGLEDDQRWIDLVNRSGSFVCLCNEEIIGMAFIIPNGNPWDVFKSEWSYIRMVGIDP